MEQTAEHNNPYRSPEDDFADIDPEPSPANLMQWLAVFGANLFIPLLFARFIVQGVGWTGVALGIVALLATTWMLHYVSSRMMKTTWRGGITVAKLQAIPILQFFAGSFGHWLADRSGAAQRSGLDLAFEPLLSNAVAGFLATVGTGLVLLFAAFLIGLVHSTKVSGLQNSGELESDPTA